LQVLLHLKVVFLYLFQKIEKNETIVKARFIFDQKNGENVLKIIASLFSPFSVNLRGGGSPSCKIKK
jgi:hypothetical protein